MRVRSAISVAVVTVSGFFGCSSGTASDPSPSGPIAIEDFPDTYANSLCDNLGGCCKSNGYSYDPNKCKATIKGFMGLFIGLVQQGSVKYDPNAAGSCMAVVPGYAQSCMEGDPDSTACRSVFSGTVPQGGACTQSAECLAPPGGEADCDNKKCVADARGVVGATCKWTCTEQGSSTSCSGGSSTSTGASCFTNDGLFCDSATQKCAQRIALGGQGCDPTGDSCVDGAYCDNQTCVAEKAVGQTCSGYNQCVASAYCEQTCLAKKPLGAACTDEFADEECIDGACEALKCAKDNDSTLGTFCGGA